MWGHNPPTVKAITLRVGILKKMARENQPSGKATPATPPANSIGLVTPIGSPKTPSKRSTDSDEEITPRRMPKRRARQNIKYNEPESEESDEHDWHQVKELDSDSEEDEWVPEGEVADGGSEMVIRKKPTRMILVNGDAETKLDEDLDSKVENVLEAPFEGEGDQSGNYRVGFWVEIDRIFPGWDRSVVQDYFYLFSVAAIESGSGELVL